MPNGTRRGHTYVRNGRTFYRSAARIKAPTSKAVVAIGIVGGGFLVVSGVPTYAVALLVVGALVGWFAWKNRRPLRTMRRASRRSYRASVRWARRKHLARTGRPARTHPTVGERLSAWAVQHRAGRLR